MRFLSLPLRNLVRRPLRSVLTVAGVAGAVAAVVALVGISRGFEQSLLDVYENREADLMVVRAGNVQRINSILDQSLGQKIAGLPGVRRAAPALMDAVALEEYDLFGGVVIQGLPLDMPPVSTVRLLEGRRIRPDDQRAVMLGVALSRRVDKRAGDSIRIIEDEPFHVVGVYESFNVYENGSMMMELGELQRLLAREGDVTAFIVTAERKDRASLERLVAQIEALGPALEAMPTREFVDTSVEIRMARALAWMTSVIALVLGTIGIVNTMLMAVFERTREVAVLRAVGWRKRRVVKLILIESLLLALCGAVLGTAFAIGLTRLLAQMPATERMVSGQIALPVIVQGFVIALIVGIAGGLYPAWRAARLDPTEGLRHE
jgi:putative ABC transport system permease protein